MSATSTPKIVIATPTRAKRRRRRRGEVQIAFWFASEPDLDSDGPLINPDRPYIDDMECRLLRRSHPGGMSIDLLAALYGMSRSAMQEYVAGILARIRETHEGQAWLRTLLDEADTDQRWSSWDGFSEDC